ncbi:60S ribosomal protein L6 [Pleosporales sp. CAS-2024a]
MSDQKASKYYAAEEEQQMKKTRKTAHATKYRDSLAPGTVLILLSGRFSGKRVVLLRQLSQGVLLITGPFPSNGVPLRRVNHRYVIATSTVIDMSSIDGNVVERTSQDAYWAREKSEAKAKAQEEEEDDDLFFFPHGQTTRQKKDTHHHPQRIADQKKVDKPLMATIKNVPHLASYLAAGFSLTGNKRPHDMVF